MKTKFRLSKWPNKIKHIEVEAKNLVDAYDMVKNEYPDWQITDFSPSYTPPTPPPDPFPSMFDIPNHKKFSTYATIV